MDKDPSSSLDTLPLHTLPIRSKTLSYGRRIQLIIVILAVCQGLAILNFHLRSVGGEYTRQPLNAQEIIGRCKAMDMKPGPSLNFGTRTASDRFTPGTLPTLISNATIWTGRTSGLEVIRGDILLDKGIIIEVGDVSPSKLRAYRSLVSVNAGGQWVTPGIVDMHSHIGVDSAPALRGSDDTNSLKSITMPWLRSLDGLNTHDDAYKLSISGGVTTANILPGSADAIGGQAFTIKLRATPERTSSSLLLEPPFTLNGTHIDPSSPQRWRQMKHACGENPSHWHSGTRMDTVWAFRQAYNNAKQLKNRQDAYCEKALGGEWGSLGDFPEDLQWEALVDVLRGRVKVHIHCYEATDLDGLVRLSNEFQFPIAAFHHAHETYLVPDLLKKSYGPTPAVALFATNARYKREAYRGSEFAARILADNGIKVAMKSDHPVLNSRYLLYEAQQAHYYGLPHHLALASVTSTPATIIGMDHRVGFLKPGHDADLVIWDSHPLALGATPVQVFIDGIAQIDKPFLSRKSRIFQQAPKTPDFEVEAGVALKYDGLPPLTTKVSSSNTVIFLNVQDIYIRQERAIHHLLSAKNEGERGFVVVKDGEIICTGDSIACGNDKYLNDVPRIDLQGGSISPSLLSYGSPLGLEHIQGERSTKDGTVLDPLTEDPPEILGRSIIIRASDGLQFSSRDALLAYRAGVTTAITAPTSSGFLSGLSVAFDTGAEHRLKKAAIVKDITALHVNLDNNKPSISTRITALRKLLFNPSQEDLGRAFGRVAEGSLPLVVQVQSADIMATLIKLKSEVEYATGGTIQLTFAGAAEAHLLAAEIAKARIGVILTPSRPFPAQWRSRRVLPGPPLTETNAIGLLLQHGVVVGIGIEEQWSGRNTRFDIGWAALESSGKISREIALALASVNLEHLLGLNNNSAEYVATQAGSYLDFEGKVIGIISQRKGTVELV